LSRGLVQCDFFIASQAVLRRELLEFSVSIRRALLWIFRRAGRGTGYYGESKAKPYPPFYSGSL